MFLLHVSLPRSVHPRGALMGRRDVGRGRRLRPVERIHRAREARKLIRGCLAYWDHPRLIRPPRTTAGAPARLGAGRGEGGRGWPRGGESSTDARSGTEPRPPTRAEAFGL